MFVEGETHTENITNIRGEDVAGPSKIRSPKKKVEKKKQSPKKKTADIVSTTLRTRSSPKALYLAIATLKPNQQACVAKIGFGNFLEFKVDGIPSRLGFFVVDNFDEKRMVIRLASDSLSVNTESISQMLGLKNEGENILWEQATGNEEMILEWKKQFGMMEEYITPSVLKTKIRQSNEVNMNFKLNFIVLFANVMGCCKKNGTCDLGILNHIGPNTNLEKVNWCDYVLSSLTKCKDGWKKNLANNFFCGPLTLLTVNLYYKFNLYMYAHVFS